MAQIRHSAEEAGTTMSCQVPEEMLNSLSEALRTQVEAPEPGEANATPRIMQSNWGVRYRWIAHARVTRTRVGADPSQVVQGTATTTTGTSRGSSAGEEGTASSSTTGRGSVGATLGGDDDHGSVTGSLGRESTSAHGTTVRSGLDGGSTGGSSIATTGPIELTEEQWVYHVSWTLRVEQDNQGDWSLNNTLSMIFTDPFSDHGSMDIGIRSITRADTTPTPHPAAHAPRPRPRPERLHSGD